MSKIKVFMGLLVAPLSTIPISAIWFSLLGIYDSNLLNGFQLGVVVGVIGTVLIAYPATIILCLTLWWVYRKNTDKLTWKLFLTSALIATLLIGNTELLEDSFGVVYLMSAASCSVLFWFIAVYRKPESK